MLLTQYFYHITGGYTDSILIIVSLNPAELNKLSSRK